MNNIRNLDYQEKLSDYLDGMSQLKLFQSYACPKLGDHLLTTHFKTILHTYLNELKSLLSDENLFLLTEYQDMLKVLKALDYIDDKETVLLKGRVACEVSL